MKTLYIARHAKSSWAEPGMRDFDRPLNERGMRDAPMMAKVFKGRDEQVDLIVSSPANRARTTAQAFVNELNIDSGMFMLNASIHEAGLNTLMRIIQALPDRSERVMLFGHNPGFSELAYYLCDEDPIELSTCAIVRIDMDVEKWELVSKGLGFLVWHDYPKKHQ